MDTTLAIDDAIAVALMKQKNVSTDDFARNHPGGQIGRRLLLSVEDLMKKGRDNPKIRSNQSIKDMLCAIAAFRVGAVSVVDTQDRIVGLIMDFVRKALESGSDFFPSPSPTS